MNKVCKIQQSHAVAALNDRTKNAVCRFVNLQY